MTLLLGSIALAEVLMFVGFYRLNRTYKQLSANLDGIK